MLKSQWQIYRRRLRISRFTSLRRGRSDWSWFYRSWSCCPSACRAESPFVRRKEESAKPSWSWTLQRSSPCSRACRESHRCNKATLFDSRGNLMSSKSLCDGKWWGTGKYHRQNGQCRMCPLQRLPISCPPCLNKLNQIQFVINLLFLYFLIIKPTWLMHGTNLFIIYHK